MRSSLVLALFAALPALADPLPRLTLVPREVTVSGLSSGAAMAVQIQTAFSSHVTGAGIVAGAPFGCAEGNVFVALNACMQQEEGSIWVADYPADPERILGVMARVEDSIDPPEGLADDRIYLFHGTLDDTVSARAMTLLRDSYLAAGVPGQNIRFRNDVAAPHAFLTEDNADCPLVNPAFINACGIDMAGDILHQLGLLTRPRAEPVPGHLIRFEQDRYFNATLGLGNEALVYIPATCAAGATCRLHIALHGCQQGLQTKNGDAFATRTGFNGWAEANDIVVLYPQAKPTLNPLINPKGCWDWWGYSAGSLPGFESLGYLKKDAPQMAAIAAMAAALGAPLTE